MKNSRTRIIGIRDLRVLMLLLLLTLTSGSVFSANYYWVGGTGSWTMLNHWATASGGTTMHTVLPGQSDNVFFDLHSFPAGGTITITGTANCNNINFTGVTSTPTLAGNGTLKVYGSLTLASAMNVTLTGPVYFESTVTGCNVNTKGKSLLGHVYFNGVGGEWTLADSLSLGNSKSVYLNNGSLITNNKNISCARFVSDKLFARSLNLGSSVVRLYDNSSNSMVLYLQNLQLNAGTSSIRFLGTTGGGIYIADQNLALPATLNNLIFAYSSGNSTLNSSGKSICTFNQVTFLGDGTINGSSTFNTLTLTAAKTYTFQAKKKQTINTALNATGSCSGYITLQSSIAGSSDTIVKASGNVSLTKCILRDICKSGAGTFTASSSVDLGNNSGWTFTNPGTTTYYWVGGSGNWNSQTHWSLTSGGAGGSCIPGPNDNVIFNAASFSSPGQIVTVNGSVAYCKNMTWTSVGNMPDLAGVSTTALKIFGSMNLNANFTLSYAGSLQFYSATTGNTIFCGGKSLNSDVYFQGTGEYTLSDSLILASNKSVFLYSGTLNTNNKKIVCSRFVSDKLTVRNLNFGSSEIIMVSTLPSTALSLNMTNLTFNGSSSLLRFTGVSGLNSGGLTINGTSSVATMLNDVVLSSPGATASLYVQTAGGAQFHNVTFLGSGTIYGKNTFNDLNFAAGSSYVFQAGKVQTINGNWNATGNCTAYTILQSTLYASPAQVVKTNGVCTLDHVLLRDIQASGGATFNATNAMNMGGNSGWAFTTPISNTYYWIGGSGNWSSQSHWSLSSGGSAASCMPGPNDDVVFDGNSFPTTAAIVTVDPKPAYCRNMTWNNPTNSPTFAGTTASFIRIFGSMRLHQSMTNNYKGKLYFESADTTNIIKTSGKIISSDIYLQGTGAWALADSLITGSTNTVFFYNGQFKTNNYSLRTLRFTSDKTTNRKLNFGSSVITVSGVTGVPAIYLNTTNMTVNAGTSRIILINYSGANAGTVYLTNSTLNSTVQLYDIDYTATSGTASLSTNSQLTANFHKVTMNGNGKILGTNIFETLLFKPGMTYTLQSGKTQTITSFWGLSGQCTTPVTIQSSILASQAKVSQATGNVNGYNLIMRDINALGGAVFNAFNSTDNGGNSGWNFTTQGTLGSPSAISGPANVCSGQTATYSVNVIPGAVSYQWTLPNGVTLVTGQGTNSITVTIGIFTSVSLSVIAFDGCNYSTSASKTISGFSVGFSAIAPVCHNGSIILLNTGSPAGGLYFGAGVTGNQFNPSLVGIGMNSIGYAYNNGSCIDTAFQTVNVMGAPSMPSQPTGQTVVCQGSSNNNYTTTVVGGASVNWNISPAGAGTITGTGTTSIVNWAPGFSGVAVISATASTSCGTSAASSVNIIVGQGPTAPAPITGPVSVCQGSPASTFGTSSYANTGFIWSISPVQAGVINGVDSTISILWNPAFSGNAIITAAAYNSCDTTAAVSFTIHVDTLVAQIIFHNGPGTVCQGSDSVHYSASSYNASGYFWTLSPSSAGQLMQSGSHSLVNFDSTFTGMATIRVYAYNNCDTIGPVSMQVSVLPGPPHPTVTVAGYILTSSQAPSYQWLLNGQPIQGETNQYCMAAATGYYSVVVANTYGCNDTSDQIFIDYITGISDITGNSFGAEVNPNPMTDGGQIVLNLNKQAQVSIELIDVTGRILVMLADGIDTPAGRNAFTINKDQLDTYHGVYYFKISAGERTKVLPVVLMD